METNNKIKYINIIPKDEKNNIGHFVIEKFYKIFNTDTKTHNAISEFIKTDFKNTDRTIFFISDENYCVDILQEVNAIHNNCKILYISDDNAKFINKLSLSKNKTGQIEHSNYVFMGMDNFDALGLNELKFITNNMITKKGIDNMTEYLCNIVNGNTIILTVDVASMCQSLQLDINKLSQMIKNINIKSIIFRNFNKLDQIDYVKNVIKNVYDVSEKKINIFTEHTKFIIYRPVEQDDKDDDPLNPLDVGWYILRGLSLNKKLEIIDKLGENDIITIDVDGADYYITLTSIDEQNSKSYHTAKSMLDCCLYPSEFKDMCFELVN